MKFIEIKLAHLGLASIVEQFNKACEIFSRLYIVDEYLYKNMQSIGEAISQNVLALSVTHIPTYGNAIPSTKRKSKNISLEMSQRIYAKLKAFEPGSLIVGRTMVCFRNFHQAVEAAENHLLNMRAKDITKVQANKHPAEIASKNAMAHRQIDSMATFFGDLEFILAYGILIFREEEHILTPVLDRMDECTRIISNYVTLHPLFKVLCGENYLSSNKVTMLAIVRLLEESKLNLRYPSEYIAEVSHVYATLLSMVCKPLKANEIATNNQDLAKRQSLSKPK